jgi:hypothetical protein
MFCQTRCKHCIRIPLRPVHSGQTRHLCLPKIPSLLIPQLLRSLLTHSRPSTGECPRHVLNAQARAEGIPVGTQPKRYGSPNSRPSISACCARKPHSCHHTPPISVFTSTWLMPLRRGRSILLSLRPQPAGCPCVRQRPVCRSRRSSGRGSTSTMWPGSGHRAIVPWPPRRRDPCGRPL